MLQILNGSSPMLDRLPRKLAVTHILMQVEVDP